MNELNLKPSGGNNKLSEIKQAWEEGTSCSITFIVTENCQLRCKYCYICGKNQFKTLSFETAKEAIDYFLEHTEIFNRTKVVFDFIGGEPFLEIELIDRLCDYFKCRSFELSHPWFNSYRFSFSTNGLLYNSPKVREYIRKNRRHLSIGFSIDGTKEKHDLQRVFPDGSGSYDLMMKNYDLWHQDFPDGMTKATIGSDDLKYVCDSVLHLWKLGINYVNMNTVFEDVWKEGDDQIFEEQLVELADKIIEDGLYRENFCSLFDRNIGFYIAPDDNSNWCGSGNLMVAVDTEGQFHPCTRLVQYSLSHKRGFVTGNVKDGIDFNLLRPFRALDRLSQSSDECINCEVASGCAWCQGNNYDLAVSDTIYQRATYICKMHKARVRANNYLWNKLDKISPPEENDVRLIRLRQRKGLQSLFVIMDSSAPSFCHYPSPKEEENCAKMEVETLKKIVFFALTENLSLQLLMGNEPLSDEFREILKWSNYVVYRPYSSLLQDGTDMKIDVFDYETDVWNDSKVLSESVILRIDRSNLNELPEWLEEHSLVTSRISIFIKDMEGMTESDLEVYQGVLDKLCSYLPEREEIKPFELSILTDRLQLTEPNHCDVGIKHFTIAPNGNFYLCPGFYFDEPVVNSLSSIDNALKTHEIPVVNKQLLRVDHAPICQGCDAYNCRRCIWLNKKTTRELNTPSRQQCICAHLERNASRRLIEPLFLSDYISISEIDYLDPFDKLLEERKTPNVKSKKAVPEC